MFCNSLSINSVCHYDLYALLFCVFIIQYENVKHLTQEDEIVCFEKSEIF